MSIVLDETTLHRFDRAGRRLLAPWRGRGDVLATAAQRAMVLARRGTWPRLAAFTALGFVAGAAMLGARKVVMQATTGLAGDWFAALKADHKLVDGLFSALDETGEADTDRRHLLISKIAYALAKHQFEEEHVVYPTLLEDGPAETPKHLDAEHFEMKSFVHALIAMPKDDPQWLKKAQALRRLIKAHVREEEEIVFPRLRDRLSAAQSQALTRALHRAGLKLA